MTDVTEILKRDNDRNDGATGELFRLVYEELRRIAAAKMMSEIPGHTMQATALVHEAFLRLVDQKEPRAWENRGHFFAAAAEAMRRILIDYARKKKSVKRGGGLRRIDLEEFAEVEEEFGEEMVEVDEALHALAEIDGPAAELVKLRLFAGLSVAEAGEMLGMSRTRAYENWKFAKATDVPPSETESMSCLLPKTRTGSRISPSRSWKGRVLRKRNGAS